jgi:hypothetical protein
MTRSKALQGLAVSVTLAIGISTASAAPPVPTFTITSGNVTMSASGTSIPFTLTSVDGFSGSLAIQVSQPTVPAGVRLPYLELGGPAIAIPLVENLTVTGSIGVLASTPSVVPVRFTHPTRNRRTAVWSFAGALLLGFRLRRRRIQAAQLLLAALLLIALTTLTACGGPPTLTPGTYTYTLTATPVDPTTTTTLSASANAVITVPPGIVTNSKPNP